MALTARLENGHITAVRIKRINKLATIIIAQARTLTLTIVVHARITSQGSRTATPATTLTIIRIVAHPHTMKN